MSNVLTKVTYIKSDGTEHPLDIIEVGELIISQNIFTPHIIGELTITDRDFWQNVMPMMGDKLEITIEKPVLPKTADELYDTIQPFYNDYTFDVYKSVQMPIDLSKKPYRDVCVYFTAGNMLNAYTTPVSKAFHDKTFKQIANDLCNTVGVEPKFYEKYVKKITYTTPKWTPLKSLTDMSDYVVAEGNRAGVLFFQNLDGTLNFVTIPSLFEGALGIYDNMETYIPPPVDKTVKENHSLFSSNRNFNKVITMQFMKVPNYMKMANKGFFKSTYSYIDLESNTVDTHEKNITDTKNLGTKLSEYLCVNKEMLGNYETNTTDISPCGNCKEYLQGYMDTKLNRMLLDMYEIRISVEGYIDRKIGQIISIDIPSQLTVNTENEEYHVPDDVYTGKFLISGIKHVFTSKTYLQEIMAVTDGINSDMYSSNNLIKWK